MKLLVTLYFLIIISFYNSHSKSQDLNVKNDIYEYSIKKTSLKDSILTLIDKRPFIYYTIGNYGHIWSLVVPDNDNYLFVSGNTRTNDCRIETISINKSILTWGLYTLPLQSNKLRLKEKVPYSPFYEELTVYSAEKEVIFRWTNSAFYSGADSKTFEKNLHSLVHIMHWIAYPDDVRKHFPSPL